MASSPLFVDPETGRIDRNRVLVEAIPLAELIGLVAVVAFIPFMFMVGLDGTGFAIVFALAMQFIFAIGAGVVLLYVIARAIQVTSE